MKVIFSGAFMLICEPVCISLRVELSAKRAIAVSDYFVKSGISPKRIKTAGKGETQIRNRCTNGVACSDKEHEYNRRTEFKFIR